MIAQLCFSFAVAMEERVNEQEPELAPERMAPSDLFLLQAWRTAAVTVDLPSQTSLQVGMVITLWTRLQDDFLVPPCWPS